MYLSRLILNPRDRAVRRDLSDCQSLHRSVLAAFTQAEGDARAAFGVLYRVETDGRTGRTVVLVQSVTEPAWGRLPTGYLLATDGSVPNPAVKSVAERYAALCNGQRLRFRLRANPTKRVAARSTDERDARMLGKRVDLRREEDQIAWLRRKGEAGGFRLVDVRAGPGVVDVRTAPQGSARGWRPDPARGGRDPLTFGAVLFDGELVVTDAEAFRRTLAAGIGSGKAYGFGLLSVAPAGG